MKTREEKLTYLRDWQARNQETIHAKAKAKYAANPEHFRAKARRWRKHYKSSGQYTERSEKSCHKCGETKPINQFHNDSNCSDGHGRACKSCVTVIGREWREKNQEKFWKTRTARSQRRWRTDVQYRLSMYLRSRLSVLLKKRGGSKTCATQQLCGCSFQELRRYIEIQWEPGMTWDNWGRDNHCWQIDHKVPVSTFDLRDPDQQKLCFHYTNLQPLWAPENRAKSNKLVP